MSKWQSFLDDPPIIGEEVVGWRSGALAVGCFNGDINNDGTGQLPQPYYTFHATHWMIPEPPHGS